MSDKDKNIRKADEIDELLGDYKKQKEEREKNFGKIDLEKPEQKPIVKKPLHSLKHSEKHGEKDNAKSKKDSKTKKISLKSAGEKFKSSAKRTKEFLKTTKGKKIVISCVAVICAAAVAAGTIAGVNYARTAYLRPYTEKYPNVNFPEGIRENFCEQYAKVPSTTGYISIEACGYSSYVAQSAATSLASLDFSNSTKELDFNTVIHIPSGKCDLENAFANAESYLALPQNITYSTLYEDYEFTVIGAFYTNKNAQDDNGYVFPYDVTQQMTPLSFNDYKDRLYHRFLYETDYDINYKEDKLLTIATDSDFMQDFEFVVVCALGAPAQDNAQPNSSVHYPQVWYDARGEINPYRFSSKWYPTVYTDKSEEETSVQSENDY